LAVGVQIQTPNLGYTLHKAIARTRDHKLYFGKIKTVEQVGPTAFQKYGTSLLLKKQLLQG
jgi:hypothetical protein